MSQKIAVHRFEIFQNSGPEQPHWETCRLSRPALTGPAVWNLG